MSVDNEKVKIEFEVWVKLKFTLQKGKYYHKGNFEKNKKHALTIEQIRELYNL